MDISVVITVYNGKELLKRYLPSILASCREYSAGKTELIVVDDASRDGTVEYVGAEYPSIKIIRLKVNKGFPGAANSGVFAARNRIVVLLNSDVGISRDFLKFIPLHFASQLIFAVRPGLSDSPGIDVETDPKIGGRFRFGSFDVPIAARHGMQFAFHAGDGASAYDRDKFVELGGFDEMFSPFYCEDTDLSYRAWKRGWRVVYEPKAMAYHQSGATIGAFYEPGYIHSTVERNRFFLMWKNITDRRMILQHIFFLPMRLLGSILKGNFVPAIGFFRALSYVGEVLAKRRLERQFLLISDRDIFNLFEE